MSRPNQFLSPEGDIEEYFVDEYWLIDQYVGDALWTWGYGSLGQLGNAQITNRSTPVTTFAGGTNWKQVSTGSNNVVAVKTDGTLWIWGRSGSGILGNGVTTTSNISTPVTTFAGGTNWKQVSVGGNHTAAIKTDGTLWIWGLGTFGVLGNGATTGTISTPVTTFAGGTNWRQVSAGGDCTAAIKTDGTLWTWGFGSEGRLGNAQTTNRSTPVTTFAGGTNWKQVSGSGAAIAAIKTDGTLWNWGFQNNGRLGNGVAALTSISTPITTFSGGTNWRQVSVGSFGVAAIKTDGTLWTWGYGGRGRLGNGITAGSSISTPVTTFAGGTNWKLVSSGSNHAVAIKTDGTLWTWGYGASGKLGNAVTTGNISTPITTFAGGTNWKQVSASYGHVAAVQAGINAEYPLS